MPVNDIRRLTPDSSRFGENIARTLRILARLVLDWCSAERQRREQRRQTPQHQQVVARSGKAAQPDAAGDLPHIGAIYFDKIAMAFSRLWNRLHELGVVRYAATFKTERGFHGPGRAMPIRRSEDDLLSLGRQPGDYRRSQHAFITEIVEKLQPAIGNARLLFRIDGNPWDADCQVHPQLDPSQWDGWTRVLPAEDVDRAFLNSAELELVGVISGAVAQLSREEVRAIGTHCSASETCRDIEYNLRAYERNMESLLLGLKKESSDAPRCAYKLVTTSREILRKSADNRPAYESARKKMLQSLATNRRGLAAFSAVQAEGAAIWDDQRVSSYQGAAGLLVAFSIYCRRGVSALGIGGPLESREIRESEDAVRKLRDYLPESGELIPDYDVIGTVGASRFAMSIETLSKQVLVRMPASLDRGDLGVP